MPTHKQILDSIVTAYTCRKHGDFAGTMAVFADGATYNLGGIPRPGRQFPTGDRPAKDGVAAMIDGFEFHEVSPLGHLIADTTDGAQAFMRWNLVVSKRPNGQPFPTQVAQFWTFNAAGKATALNEYCDTALIDDL